MEDNCFVIFLFKPLYFRKKRARQNEIFRLLSGWVKIHQIHLWYNIFIYLIFLYLLHMN